MQAKERIQAIGKPDLSRWVGGTATNWVSKDTSQESEKERERDGLI